MLYVLGKCAPSLAKDCARADLPHPGAPAGHRQQECNIWHGQTDNHDLSAQHDHAVATAAPEELRATAKIRRSTSASHVRHRGAVPAHKQVGSVVVMSWIAPGHCNHMSDLERCRIQQQLTQALQSARPSMQQGGMPIGCGEFWRLIS